MASSGQITLSTQSVDYGGGRGAITLTNVIGWSVDNSSNISFWSISSSDNAGGYWGICYGSGPYYVRLIPQVSYDNGGSWNDLASATHLVNSMCTDPPDTAHYTNTISMSLTLIGSLGSYHLSGNCLLRFLYYMDPTPAPSASNPNAFPNESYSAAVQVPVDVDVSWTATLKYNANGGSGAPSNQTHSQTGNSDTFTVSNTKPTRTNYRFDGWTYNSNTYHGGDNFTIYKSDPTITLMAKWTRYYRPGATLSTAGGNNIWYSNEKTNGACHVLSDVDNVTWKEMRTIDGASGGQGDPPLILHAADSNSWYNQKRLGKES